MKRLLKFAGLNETLPPHSLRHTHTSFLAEDEVVLEDIMERLGHGRRFNTDYLSSCFKRKKEKGFSQVYSTYEKPFLKSSVIAKC
jgi:integrase